MARVALRSVTKADLSLVEPWYAEAAAAVSGTGETIDGRALQRQFAEARKLPGALLLIVRTDDPSPIGLLDYRADEPAQDWITIRFLAMASGQRGWGFGSEAVRLLEGEQRASHYLTRIAPRNGLAVYFWRLLGYRPARPGDSVWLARSDGDMIAMIRDTS